MPAKHSTLLHMQIKTGLSFVEGKNTTMTTRASSHKHIKTSADIWQNYTSSYLVDFYPIVLEMGVTTAVSTTSGYQASGLLSLITLWSHLSFAV